MIHRSLTDSFALTTGALYRAVAACLGRGLMAPAMIVLVCGRVRRAEWQFLALVARVCEGRFRSRPPSGDRVSRSVGPDDEARTPAPPIAKRGRLPVRFGWLMAVMPYEAASYAGQLRTLLAQPDMVALLRDVAQARRILAPVCRMLGVEIAGVAPLVRAEKALAETSRAARVRVAAVREKVDFGRIPLPRGVLAAARRQGYGRVRFSKDE